ncbi:hypothetical protein BLS_001777 [Venturia inaequalis]|uniref:BTB domain-containing protein n=1 Tax=Venturia inaequalis TaxID=5025 RepID=A0A8H3VKS2_VENIN|nr:hypothetical protein BLS_001777 [Venturia inaequalis]KAE9990989.1 hypothetical protein EG327_000646 [Venturia inaequalis]RDI79577.1 hypothetical protein Vi05172_g10489 [Venturia inaequalis]
MEFSVPELDWAFERRDWPLEFSAYHHVSEIITIISDDGDQCHVHGHILSERASALYTSAEWESGDSRAEINVQANGDVLQLFTNWIYNGVIRLPEEHEEINNPLTFEGTCQRALKEAQNGFPITAQHRWIKREDEESSVEGMEIPQLRMARLVDLFEFAHQWDIVELEQDILESLFVTFKVAQKLPSWDIVNKACCTAGDIQSDLVGFLIDLFVENWSFDVSDSLCFTAEEMHPTFIASVLQRITLQKEESVHERQRATLRAVTAEEKLKTAERELTRYKNASTSAAKMLATTRQALADAQAKTAPPGSAEEFPATKKQQPVGKENAMVKTKSAVKRKSVTKAKPTPVESNKRAREEDAVDLSEIFRQSLKRNCRELRPRTGCNGTVG